MPTLKQAQIDGSLEAFIREQEPLEAEKEDVERYINASAIPSESSKEDQSNDFLDGSADCT